MAGGILRRSASGWRRDDDDDLDGRTNWQEFLAGTNPTVVDAAPKLEMKMSGNNLEFTLPPFREDR